MTDFTGYYERGDDTPMGEVERLREVIETALETLRDTWSDETIADVDDLLSAALASVPDHPIPEAGVREGWVQVPRELTNEMLAAGKVVPCDAGAPGGVVYSTSAELRAIWSAMLAAAIPEPVHFSGYADHEDRSVEGRGE